VKVLKAEADASAEIAVAGSALAGSALAESPWKALSVSAYKYLFTWFHARKEQQNLRRKESEIFVLQATAAVTVL
jgi:hypothetical protein